MSDEQTNHDFTSISALIREEEEAALAFFRMRDFQRRVEIRQEKETGGKAPRLLSQIKAISVVATVLTVIVIGVFFLLLKQPGGGPPSEFGSLASALGRLPGFSHPLGLEGAMPGNKAGMFQLAESVRLALISAEKTKRDREQALAVPAGPIKVPRLSLDQKMEILFKERAIERAFFLLRQDLKEV